MSRIDTRWADEEAWWTMGSAEARRRMHPSCVMAFAGGLMQGDDILAAMDSAQRWDSVVMTDRVMVETGDCVVLAYRAEARHPDGRQHRALCTSTWVQQDDGWLLLQHQQGPATAEG